MTAQVLFFQVFSEKDPHLNAVEHTYASPTRKIKVLYYQNLTPTFSMLYFRILFVFK